MVSSAEVDSSILLTGVVLCPWIFHEIPHYFHVEFNLEPTDEGTATVIVAALKGEQSA